MATNPNVFLSSALIRNIKLRALVPANQITLQEDDFISLINSELFGLVIPMIMAYQEEFYVTFADITSVANQSDYSIPEDATGMKIRVISQVTSNGQTIPLARLSVDQLSGVDQSLVLSHRGFYIKGNKVVLYPTPTNGSETFRIFYYKRPNRIVKTTQSAIINSIDTNTKVINVTNTPSDWLDGNVIHTVSPNPMFDDTSENVTILVKAGNQLQLDSVDGMSVGDYVVRKGESPFAHMPVEGYPMLEQAVVVKVLEALGDREGMSAAQAKLVELIDRFPTLFSPRSDGNSLKIINRNAISKFVRR